MSAKMQKKIVIGLSVVFLVFAYFCCGYGVCAGIPQTTTILAKLTIDDTASPFSDDQLIEGAAAVRDYSFGSHDQQKLLDTLNSMNRSANTPYQNLSLDDPSIPDQYTLNAEAIAHLDDVQEIATAALYPMLGVTALAVFCLMCTLWMFGLAAAGSALRIAGYTGLAIMALLALWALFGFSSLFTLFHGLFFAEGSWTFPIDSLLITMLPQGFWIGMALTWLATSTVMCVGSLIIGIVIKKKETPVSSPAPSSPKDASAEI